MRYVIVNGRVPMNSTHCTFCPAKFEDGYVRDLETSLLYCTLYCLEAHIYASQRSLTCIHIPIIERRPA